MAAMLKTPKLVVVLGFSVLMLGCGGDDDDSPGFTADVSGTYTVALTNSSVNATSASCPFRNSMPGEMSVGVMFNITQNGNALTGTVTDPASALILGLTLGTANFSGSVSGNDVMMLASGTLSRTEGSCAYFMNATLSATLSENALSGTVTYAPDTNNSPECATLVCSATQAFSGSRPPR